MATMLVDPGRTDATARHAEALDDVPEHVLPYGPDRDLLRRLLERDPQVYLYQAPGEVWCAWLAAQRLELHTWPVYCLTRRAALERWAATGSEA